MSRSMWSLSDWLLYLRQLTDYIKAMQWLVLKPGRLLKYTIAAAEWDRQCTQLELPSHKNMPQRLQRLFYGAHDWHLCICHLLADEQHLQ